jgi:hypothetical protein
VLFIKRKRVVKAAQSRWLLEAIPDHAANLGVWMSGEEAQII